MSLNTWVIATCDYCGCESARYDYYNYSALTKRDDWLIDGSYTYCPKHKIEGPEALKQRMKHDEIQRLMDKIWELENKD